MEILAEPLPADRIEWNNGILDKSRIEIILFDLSEEDIVIHEIGSCTKHQVTVTDPITNSDVTGCYLVGKNRSKK